MELKEFITHAINDVVEAVRSSNEASDREVKLISSDNSRTVEFDIAVSAEEKLEGKIGGGIKVWGVVSGEAGKTSEITNSTVSRLRFGVDVNRHTKQENSEQDALIKAQFQKHQDWRTY